MSVDKSKKKEENKKQILIIQTAFIGDVILASSLVDLVSKKHPGAEIHFFLRKGNEGLFENHPHIHHLWVWDKKSRKTKNLFRLIRELRSIHFDLIINIQRFFSSGLLTFFLKADQKAGFDKNPWSFSFDNKVAHKIPHKKNGQYLHEVQRNAQLLEEDLIHRPLSELRPKLYPGDRDLQRVSVYSQKPYVVMAPTSVWYTKQWHQSRWVELIRAIGHSFEIFYIGAPGDHRFCEELREKTDLGENLCGELSFLESAALMMKAKRVFVNDSAPLHLASAVNAKTTAIFCSTIPEFGYYPLAENSQVIQREPRLDCMPCGLHGKKTCPEGHFRCALDIDIRRVHETLYD